MGTAVAKWLRCCATNRKVAGSIPDGVIGIFHWHNPSDRTMALGLTQPLTEMSTRKISWRKCGRCLRLTTLPPSCTVVMKSGNLNFLEPSGPLQACNGTDLPLSTLYRMPQSVKRDAAGCMTRIVFLTEDWVLIFFLLIRLLSGPVSLYTRIKGGQKFFLGSKSLKPRIRTQLYLSRIFKCVV